MVQLRRYFFFFFENAKNLGRSDDAKRRKKKRMALTLMDKLNTFILDLLSHCLKRFSAIKLKTGPEILSVWNMYR